MCSLQAWLVKIQTVDASSHHAANEWHTSICTAPISSPLSPLTCDRGWDFGGISGGYQVTGKLAIACCLLLTFRVSWEHFSSNNQQTVTDRPATKIFCFGDRGDRWHNYCILLLELASHVFKVHVHRHQSYMCMTSNSDYIRILQKIIDTGWYYS